MKIMPKGTRVVVYTPEYTGGLGIHTVTEKDMFFSEEIIKGYYDEFDGILEIRDYLGVEESDNNIIRLSFDLSCNLLKFEPEYDSSAVYYLWIATKSLI